jgi:hypothetical protein
VLPLLVGDRGVTSTGRSAGPAFMVNSTYFWFDHEFDQNFVELTTAGLPDPGPRWS